MRFIGTEPIKCPKYDEMFEEGDLIVPNRGIQFSFKWRKGLKVVNDYFYHKANSAEHNYFYKQLMNGYGVLAIAGIPELLSLNLRTFATNLDEL